jgi:hypothetical protein
MESLTDAFLSMMLFIYDYRYFLYHVCEVPVCDSQLTYMCKEMTEISIQLQCMYRYSYTGLWTGSGFSDFVNSHSDPDPGMKKIFQLFSPLFITKSYCKYSKS